MSRLTRYVDTQDQLQKGLGLLAWNFPPSVIGSNAAPTSQTLYAMVLPTTAGVLYTGVKISISTASSGTTPTGFFVGLASNAAIGSAGTMLAQSGNLNGNSFAAGVQSFAFSATYTETVTGLRMVLLLQNGTFSVTNPTIFKTAAGGIGVTAGQIYTGGTAGTSVTALASNGSAVAANYSGTSPQTYWVALY